VDVELAVQRYPEGSVLYRSGRTTVLVAASVEEGVADWLAGSGKGWVTAEYAMHPRANPERRQREGHKGRVDGRSQEIQRLIGRSLRAAVALENLGERSITVDCDVLDADGGTRTASITGGFLALVLALDGLRRRGLCGPGVLRAPVAAVSSGFWSGYPILDLCYEEDRDADVDLNVVGTGSGALVEVQGTAEGAPVPKSTFDAMVELGLAGVAQLVELEVAVLGQHGVDLQALMG
jgi:ribonuclease PH